MVVTVPASVLGQAPPEQATAAVLHTQGGVWVNGYEAHDSSAIFTGDLIETKPGFSAILNMEGSTVQIQPESVAKLQQNLLVLDHGSVSVGTSTGFKVKVNCITAIPVLNTWTQYDVTDLNGTVQVSARKQDVRVEHEMGHGKPSAETQASDRGVVHETEQKNYDESQLCGAAGPLNAGSGLNPKWIVAGAAGAGVLIWILVHGGGGKTPLSTSQP